MSNFRPLLLQRYPAAAPGRLLTGHEDVAAIAQPHGRSWSAAGCPGSSGLSIATLALVGFCLSGTIGESPLFSAVNLAETGCRTSAHCYCGSIPPQRPGGF